MNSASSGASSGLRASAMFTSASWFAVDATRCRADLCRWGKGHRSYPMTSDAGAYGWNCMTYRRCHGVSTARGL